MAMNTSRRVLRSLMLGNVQKNFSVRVRPVARMQPLGPRLPSVRQYSLGDKETEDKTEAATAKAAATETSTEGTDAPVKENNQDNPTPNVQDDRNAALVKELAEMKDRYLRQVAEFRNLQTRTEREVKNAKDFAIQKFAKDLLDSLDNLERALGIVPEEHRANHERNAELVSLYSGLKMTDDVLMKTLERHGLKSFTGLNEKFDPKVHEVMYEVPMPGKEHGTIFQCDSTGYLLNGRTIRAAKVGVVKGE